MHSISLSISVIKVLKCTGLSTEPRGTPLIPNFQLEHGAIAHNSLAASSQPIPACVIDWTGERQYNEYLFFYYLWMRSAHSICAFVSCFFFNSAGKLLAHTADWVGHLNISFKNVCSNLANGSSPTWRCSRWLSMRTSVLTAQVNALLLHFLCSGFALNTNFISEFSL